MNWITSLISPVANVAGQIIKNRGEIAKAKHDAQMQTIQNNADWESKMADASANSWKDEFWTLVLAVPIFMIGYSIIVDDPSKINQDPENSAWFFKLKVKDPTEMDTLMNKDDYDKFAKETSA